MNPEDINRFQSIEKLFKSCYKPLRSYAYRFVNETCTAEDIVQDVFCGLWLRRNSIHFDNTELVKSYLFKAVYNRSINVLVHNRPNKLLALDKISEAQTVENLPNSYVQDQEQQLLLKELDGEIVDFIKTLPLQRKKVFTLSRSIGLKNIEIAEQLGVSLKAVEKQISKALYELKKHLKSKGFSTCL
jgi:RNA polymerase sigma-70 factor (ECF subfamily)